MPELKKEQAQAVFHNDGNILVSASAGSGKTFVMIERLIRLICEGRASVKEILAVTFTELAASEMKEKLKLALTEKINQTGDKRLIKELAEIPTADISTMHAFCSRLIRLYFYQVGLAPDFKILDEGGSDALRQESVNKAFRELYESGDEQFRLLVDRHLDKRTDESLKSTIIRMSEAGRVNARSNIYAEQAERLYCEQGLNLLLEQFKAQIDCKLDLLLEQIKNSIYIFNEQGNDKVVEFAKGLLDDVSAVRADKDVYVFKRFENYKRDLPKGVRFSGQLKQDYRQLVGARDEFKALISSTCNGLSDRQNDFSKVLQEREHVLGLFKIVERYEQIYTALKREENGLDFADLEHFALEILSDSQIRKAVSDKYKYVFVDEYQDTNDVQEQLICALAKDNLFMVGDAKQSIYGFRGCRPEIFISKLNQMSQSGQKTVLLNHNFRSSDKVIEFVNKVFSFSMTKEYFGMSYKDTSLLVPGGAYNADSLGRVNLHLFLNPPRQNKQKEQPRIYDLLQEINKPDDDQLLQTPTLIASIIQGELGKDYFDIKDKTFKPVTFGDIAILTRNKDNKYVRDIVKTLIGYGIPVCSSVKENVCDYPEIRSLISALKLIDCFSQDIPLASVLKSQIGGFTDEDLAQIVIEYDGQNKGGFYNAFMYYINNVNNALSQRLKAFYEYFEGVRKLADFFGAHGALKKLVGDKNLEQCLYAQPSGRLKVKRLRRFIGASVVEGNAYTVKEFLDRIERFPSAFGLSDGAEENSVKIMTIHASKGLEFPVVIVCGLERHANSSDERDEIMFDQDLGFAVKGYDDDNKTTRETPLRMVFRHRLRENRLKEELRLFYVALTRAKYSLHLTFAGSKDVRKEVFNGANKFLDYLPKDIELETHTADEFTLFSQVNGIRKVLIGAPDRQIAKRMQDNFAFSYPYIQDTTLPLKNTVTRATSELTQEQAPVYVLFDDEVTDKDKGNVAHKLMEFYDFNSGLDILEQANQLVKIGVLTAEQVNSINLDRIKKAVLSPEFEKIKGKKLYREKGFIASVKANLIFDTLSTERALLQGVIDLLAVGKEGAVIIDYKYSALEINSLKARYKKQLDLYAHALEISTGIKTQEKILVNLFTGDTVSV